VVVVCLRAKPGCARDSLAKKATSIQGTATAPAHTSHLFICCVLRISTASRDRYAGYTSPTHVLQQGRERFGGRQRFGGKGRWLPRRCSPGCLS
jgi:hypothetical protein